MNVKRHIIFHKHYFMEEIRNVTNFDELLDVKYGKIGTQQRDEFEEQAQYYVISEMLKRSKFSSLDLEGK